MSDPPGMITGSLFGYTGSYIIVDSINPGSAYWVKVSQDGSLILSSGTSNSANTIRIVPTSELPPPLPPNEELSNLEPLTPNQFSLEQNYPNPFNPLTVIRYQLPVQGHVSLKVFNVLGQEVAALVDGMQEAGFKSVKWDASGVPSGIYFYRIQAGGFVQTLKLLLIR